MSWVARQFYEALGARESGGQYDVVNSLGYLGKYQMGELALIDAGYYRRDGTVANDWSGEWTGKDGVFSRESFLQSAVAQENAVRIYHRKIWRYVRAKGFDRYAGRMIGNIRVTDAGMLAASHLVGVGGLKKFLNSEGKTDPVDGFGTPVSEYLRKFSGMDVSGITGRKEQLGSENDDDGLGEEQQKPSLSDKLAKGNESAEAGNATRLIPSATKVSAGRTSVEKKNTDRRGGNVVINGRTAVHAGSGGTVTSPDVCKTPGKCRPRAYRNVAKSADAAQTAGTVFINGHPACHKDSIFSTSSGDEGGSCGGVRSGTIKGKAEFITASPNVMFEGVPAVRQGDLMVSNNRNTPPMPLMQPGAGKPPALDLQGADGLEASEPPARLDLTMGGEGVGIEKGLTGEGDDE